MIGNINSNYYSSLYQLNNLNSFNQSRSINSYSQIYNALNASSSLYGRNTLGNVNYSSVQSISALKTDATDLSKTIRDLQNGSAFSRKSATSSDAEALSVSTGKATRVSMPDMEVDISQLASGQVNEGNKMRTSGLAQAGEYQVQLEAGGRTRNIAFSVREGESNYQMQQRMADAINNAGMGVRASVAREDGQSTLRLESTETGEDATTFAVRDYVGNAVAQTGVGTVTQEAQDAVYAVNGVRRTSSTNEVNLGNDITGTLKEAGTSVTVSMEQDSSAGVASAREFVNAYNTLLTSEDGNSRLSRELGAVTRAYSSSLDRLGISIGSDGRLGINSDKLNAAAENGSLERFFTQDYGRSYGFTSQLNRTAGAVSRAPLNYMDTSSGSGLESLFSGSNFYTSQMGFNQNNNMMGLFFNLMI